MKGRTEHVSRMLMMYQLSWHPSIASSNLFWTPLSFRYLSNASPSHYLQCYMAGAKQTFAVFLSFFWKYDSAKKVET